jgi:hypothetical protein
MAVILESLGPDNGDIVDSIRYFWITGHGPTGSNVSKNTKKVIDGAIRTVDELANEMAVIISNNERFKAMPSGICAATATMCLPRLKKSHSVVLEVPLTNPLA